MSLNTIGEKLKSKDFKLSVKDNSIIISTPELDFKEIYKLKEKMKETIISKAALKTVARLIQDILDDRNTIAAVSQLILSGTLRAGLGILYLTPI